MNIIFHSRTVSLAVLLTLMGGAVSPAFSQADNHHLDDSDFAAGFMATSSVNQWDSIEPSVDLDSFCDQSLECGTVPACNIPLCTPPE